MGKEADNSSPFLPPLPQPVNLLYILQSPFRVILERLKMLPNTKKHFRCKN